MKRKITAMLLCVPFLTKAASIDEKINESFSPVSQFFSKWIFYPISIFGHDVPIVVIVLITAALFFTFFFKFANFRYLGIAINAAKGKYDDVDVMHDGSKEDEEDNTNDDVIGEVTHFQALTAALSATVGLGNIAGVAVAIALGGPGATFWMIFVGLLGMSTKLVEATLGVKYREMGADGKTYGGPMYYLSKGFRDRKMGRFGKILAVMFSVFVVGGALGAGNMLQVNQAASQFAHLFHLNSTFWFGIVTAIVIGFVIIGGIKRIAHVTEKVVPFMAILYVAAAVLILVLNMSLIPKAFVQIFHQAFTGNAALGGVVGVMIVGFQRAAFSNEAGIGSASIAHSAVKTRFPASEGIVASIGPFVDTVVICTMTALVIIISNLRNNLFDYANLDAAHNVILKSGESVGGVDLTSVAFDAVLPNFSILLTIAVILFAISTMLSWSYYGLQGWKYLFGKGKVADVVYKCLFLVFVVIGASCSLDSVISFSDAMLFAMVFPNVIGLLVLTPEVKSEITRYLKAINFSKKKHDQ